MMSLLSNCVHISHFHLIDLFINSSIIRTECDDANANQFDL